MKRHKVTRKTKSGKTITYWRGNDSGSTKVIRGKRKPKMPIKESNKPESLSTEELEKRHRDFAEEAKKREDGFGSRYHREKADNIRTNTNKGKEATSYKPKKPKAAMVSKSSKILPPINGGDKDVLTGFIYGYSNTIKNSVSPTTYKNLVKIRNMGDSYRAREKAKNYLKSEGFIFTDKRLPKSPKKL